MSLADLSEAIRLPDNREFFYNSPKNKSFGLNWESGYFVLEHSGSAIVCTVGAIGSGILCGITSLPSCLHPSIREITGQLFTYSEVQSFQAHETLCGIALVFQKNLNPWMPHILAVAAVITPLALAQFHYLPNVVLSHFVYSGRRVFEVAQLTMVPIALVCVLDWIESNLSFFGIIDKNENLEAQCENQLRSSFINPICSTVVYRALLQTGLMAAFEYIFENQMVLILGMPCSVAGVATLLSIGVIMSLMVYSCGNMNKDSIIEIALAVFLYGPLSMPLFGPFCIHFGFLASLYSETLIATARTSVVPMTNSLFRTTYINFLSEENRKWWKTEPQKHQPVGPFVTVVPLND